MTCQTTSIIASASDLNCNGKSGPRSAEHARRTLTPLPSLEIGQSNPVTTGVDTNVGYTRVLRFLSNCAGAEPDQPAAVVNLMPRFVYTERCYESHQPGRSTGRRDMLLLDQVIARCERTVTAIGAPTNRHRMAEVLAIGAKHRTTTRRQKQPGGSAWKPRAKLDPAMIPGEDIARPRFRARAFLMFDMMRWRSKTDTTRICTFMFGQRPSVAS